MALAKDRLRCSWRDVVERFEPYVRRVVKHSDSLIRLHLALFYMFGMYYDVPKRILGVKYLGYGPTAYTVGPDGRPGTLSRLYRVLGVLLMAQALTPMIRSLVEDISGGRDSARDCETPEQGDTIEKRERGDDGNSRSSSWTTRGIRRLECDGERPPRRRETEAQMSALPL